MADTSVVFARKASRKASQSARVTMSVGSPAVPVKVPTAKSTLLPPPLSVVPSLATIEPAFAELFQPPRMSFAMVSSPVSLLCLLRCGGLPVRVNGPGQLNLVQLVKIV